MEQIQIDTCKLCGRELNNSLNTCRIGFCVSCAKKLRSTKAIIWKYRHGKSKCIICGAGTKFHSTYCEKCSNFRKKLNSRWYSLNRPLKYKLKQRNLSKIRTYRNKYLKSLSPEELLEKVGYFKKNRR